MKTFKQHIRETPGAVYWGTHELRKKYVKDTPGQTDPVKSKEPTPSVYDKKQKKPK